MLPEEVMEITFLTLLQFEHLILGFNIKLNQITGCVLKLGRCFSPRQEKANNIQKETA